MQFDQIQREGKCIFYREWRRDITEESRLLPAIFRCLKHFAL